MQKYIGTLLTVVHCNIVTLLHRYIATLLHRYIATLLYVIGRERGPL